MKNNSVSNRIAFALLKNNYLIINTTRLVLLLQMGKIFPFYFRLSVLNYKCVSFFFFFTKCDFYCFLEYSNKGKANERKCFI